MPINNKKISAHSIKPLSEEAYLKNGSARKLPLYKCLITSGWAQRGTVQVMVSRQHITGNVTGAFYLLDLWCAGVRDCFYFFNEAEDYLPALTERMSLNSYGVFEDCTYELAHNVIFSAVEYAGDYKIESHPAFKICALILEEDTDNIEFIDVTCGRDGKPCLIATDSDEQNNYYLKQLDKYAGKGNYKYLIDRNSRHTAGAYGAPDEQENPAKSVSDDFQNWTADNWHELIESGSLERLQADMDLPAYIYHRGILSTEADKRQVDLNALREKLTWGITHEPVKASSSYGDGIEEDKEIQLLHAMIFSKKRIDNSLLKRIRAGIATFPENPVFQNYLYNALAAAGKKAEADALIPGMISTFPDYLFAKIAMGHLYKEQNKLSEIARLFDHHFDLHSLYPHRMAFHISEFLNFTSLICLYYLDKKDHLLAETYALVIRENLISRTPQFTTDVLGLADVNMLKQVALKLAAVSESSRAENTFIDLLIGS